MRTAILRARERDGEYFVRAPNGEESLLTRVLDQNPALTIKGMALDRDKLVMIVETQGEENEKSDE